MAETPSEPDPLAFALPGTRPYQNASDRRQANELMSHAERWLLLSNCQTFGLANCLQLLSPSLDVEAVDIWTYDADPSRYNSALAEYDRVVVHPDLATRPGFTVPDGIALNHLPSIDFGAYHPDFGYFQCGSGFVQGPMTAYQSILAVAAFNAGLTLSDTRALYDGKIYEQAGYHLDWIPQRDALIQRFRDHGVDLAAIFQGWGRGRSFMFSVNHPRIEQLHDVARQFLTALGMPVLDAGLVPSDNLMLGPCLPVYSEVGEMLGVGGSYLFKLAGQYRYITLDEFLRASFDAFATYAPGGIAPHPHYRARYDHVLSIIKGVA